MPFFFLGGGGGGEEGGGGGSLNLDLTQDEIIFLNVQ